MIYSIIFHPIRNDVCKLKIIIFKIEFRLKIDISIIPDLKFNDYFTSIVCHIFEMTHQLSTERIHVIENRLFEEKIYWSRCRRRTDARVCSNNLISISIQTSHVVCDITLWTFLHHCVIKVDNDICLCCSEHFVEH